MKILHKYVLKEHLGPFLFAFSALTSILFLQTIAKQFGNLVGKGLPTSVIVQFFALSLPYTLALTLPMAVLVATLYAFSRLASENEITALKASGIGMSTVLTPVLIASLGVTLVMLFFNDQILPRTNHQLSSLMSDIAQTKPTFALREQIINEVIPGKFYLRANHIQQSRLMREVTIYDLTDATRRRTIIADSGTLGMAPNKSDLLMTLYHGVMMDVPIAKPEQLQRLFYATDLIRVKGVANQFQKSTTSDSRSPREQSVCQMQRDVDRATHDYATARTDFLAAVALAKQQHVQLDRHVTQMKTGTPPRITLGGTYCALLKRLGVPELKAQVPQRPQQTPPRQTPAQQIPPPRPTPLRTVPPKNVPPRTVPPASGAPRPPVPGVMTIRPMQPVLPQRIAPVTVEGIRIRMLDARLTMNMIDVEIHKKFALAVACSVFVLLGAPIALRFPRGGVGLTIGVSLLVFAIYYVGLIAGASLGSRGIIPPWAAMWATNVIFGGIGTILAVRMGKEGSTARGGDAAEVLDNIKRGIRAVLQRVGFARERRSAA